MNSCSEKYRLYRVIFINTYICHGVLALEFGVKIELNMPFNDEDHIGSFYFKGKIMGDLKQ